MKKKTAVPIFAVILLFSCTSNRLITATSRTAYFEEINQTGKVWTSQIVQLDGQKFVGRKLHLAQDSTSWTDVFTGLTKTVPTKDLKEIVFVRTWRGARDGFLIGAVTGFALGCLLLVVDTGDPCEGCSNVYEYGLIVSGYIGAAGGVLGFLVGTAAGSKDRYVLNKSNALLR